MGDRSAFPGVLQRIAFCYLAGTAMLLYTTRKQQGVIAAVLLVGYWVLLAFVPVPGAGVVPMTREFASQNWAAWIDQLTMGRHLGYGIAPGMPMGCCRRCPRSSLCRPVSSQRGYSKQA